MHFITLVVSVLIAIGGYSGCGSHDGPRVEQSSGDSAEVVPDMEPEEIEADTHEPESNAQGAPPFEGCWIASEDPTGEVSNEGLYTNSRVRFAADGGYTFALGSSYAMRGTWEILSQDGDTITYRSVYSGGRVAGPTTVSLRRADEAVVGIVIRDDSGPRYYSRSEEPDSQERGCGALAREPQSP